MSSRLPMHSLIPSKISISLQSSVTDEIVDEISLSIGNCSDVMILFKIAAVLFLSCVLCLASHLHK